MSCYVKQCLLAGNYVGTVCAVCCQCGEGGGRSNPLSTYTSSYHLTIVCFNNAKLTTQWYLKVLQQESKPGILRCTYVVQNIH